MSTFLPDSPTDTSTVYTPGPGPADDRTRALIDRVFGHPELLNSKTQFVAWIASVVEAANIQIPISQIAGAGLFTPSFAQVLTAQDLTGTTSYSDLATTGPTISGLTPGTYVGIWTAALLRQGVTICNSYVTVAVNGSDIGDSNAGFLHQDISSGTVVGMMTGALTAGTNTVKMRYRIDDAAATMRFGYRNLMVLKVSG